jgi:hypothetical protein
MLSYLQKRLDAVQGRRPRLWADSDLPFTEEAHHRRQIRVSGDSKNAAPLDWFSDHHSSGE